MTCYIVAFQAEKTETRNALRALLKTYSGYCPITRTCWAVLSDEKAGEVRDHLKTALQPGDRIFVVRSGTAAAWRNMISDKHSAWLKKNL